MVDTINAKDFINNAKSGDTAVVELARRDNEEGTAPDWKKAQTITLYVQRRDKPYKRDRYRIEPKGHLIILTIAGGAWAEYHLDDWSEQFATFGFDDWHMHIIEWNGKKIDDPYFI